MWGGNKSVCVCGKGIKVCVGVKCVGGGIKVCVGRGSKGVRVWGGGE